MTERKPVFHSKRRHLVASLQECSLQNKHLTFCIIVAGKQVNQKGSSIGDFCKYHLRLVTDSLPKRQNKTCKSYFFFLITPNARQQWFVNKEPSNNKLWCCLTPAGLPFICKDLEDKLESYGQQSGGSDVHTCKPILFGTKSQH